MSTKKYLVRDYMSKRIVTVTENATFEEAMRLFIAEKTNGLVVIDEKKKVKGILSSWDMIQYTVPDYLEQDKHLASFESGDVFAQRIHELAHHPISKFMTKKVKTVQPSHTLMEAATLLSEFRIRQLPVVNEKGVLVGYINRTDIKKVMATILGIQ